MLDGSPTFGLRPSAAAARFGIGSPFGFFRWNCERQPFSARCLSLTFER
jgi:hypothetical protein